MIKTHKTFACLLAACMIAVDQISKIIAYEFLKPCGIKINAIPKLFNFVYVENRGAAFGMLSDNRWIFMILTTVFLAAAIICFFFCKIKSKLVIYALMLIVSGGIGNMIDRIFRGFVVDFIDFDFMRFYVFNIADCCVVIGCALFILYLLTDTIKDLKVKKSGGDNIA